MGFSPAPPELDFSAAPPPLPPGVAGAPPPPPPSYGGPPLPPPGSYGGPPPPPGPTPASPLVYPAAPAALPLLVVACGEDRVVVSKERFIIGRVRHSSDLAIRDPNVSRQHAMVEYVGGRFYIVDLGSTNGVEFDGLRIGRKPILEGDRFRIGDHEVVFSYRA